MTQIRWGGKWVHLAYIWIVSHLSAKNYRNLWKFDEVLTKTNLLSFFLGHGVVPWHEAAARPVHCHSCHEPSLSTASAHEPFQDDSAALHLLHKHTTDYVTSQAVLSKQEMLMVYHTFFRFSLKLIPVTPVDILAITSRQHSEHKLLYADVIFHVTEL